MSRTASAFTSHRQVAVCVVGAPRWPGQSLDAVVDSAAPHTITVTILEAHPQPCCPPTRRHVAPRPKRKSLSLSLAVSDPAALEHENHTRNFRAFLSALDEGRRFEVDGAEARKAVELILAVYESARNQPPQ